MRKRSPLLSKKVLPSIIVLTLIIATLVAAVTNIQQVTELFSFAKQVRKSSVSSTVGGSYDFSCITSQKCQFLSDGDQKNKCYAGCRKNLPDSGLGEITPSMLADKHLEYLKNYTPLYSGTRRGSYQEHTKKVNTMTGYARSNCSDIAANALVGLVEKKPQSYFSLQAERLTAVFDDANVWASTSSNDFWLSPAAGYQCGLAASLLWDKLESKTAWDRGIGKPNRTADEKRAMIRGVLLDLAVDINSQFRPDHFKAVQKKEGKKGNSQLEETAISAAYLSFVSQMFPESGAKYLDPAKKLSEETMKFCRFNTSAFEICNYDGNFNVANHGIYPQPHYGLAGIMHNAWAGLPFYTFGNLNRDSIPKEFRLLSKSVYNLVNAFEGTSQNIDYVNFKYTGSFQDLNKREEPNFSQSTYDEVEYNGRKGVTEWGVGPEYHAGAITYMFVNDPFDSSNYRDATGPTAWFIKGSDALLKDDKLYLPATIGKPRTMLDALHSTTATYPLSTNNEDQLENSHFMLNSFQAFEHVIGYLYTTDKNYLNKME